MGVMPYGVAMVAARGSGRNDGESATKWGKYGEDDGRYGVATPK